MEIEPINNSDSAARSAAVPAVDATAREQSDEWRKSRRVRGGVAVMWLAFIVIKSESLFTIVFQGDVFDIDDHKLKDRNSIKDNSNSWAGSLSRSFYIQCDELNLEQALQLFQIRNKNDRLPARAL